MKSHLPLIALVLCLFTPLCAHEQASVDSLALAALQQQSIHLTQGDRELLEQLRQVATFWNDQAAYHKKCIEIAHKECRDLHKKLQHFERTAQHSLKTVSETAYRELKREQAKINRQYYLWIDEIENQKKRLSFKLEEHLEHSLEKHFEHLNKEGLKLVNKKILTLQYQWQKIIDDAQQHLATERQNLTEKIAARERYIKKQEDQYQQAQKFADRAVANINPLEASLLEKQKPFEATFAVKPISPSQTSTIPKLRRKKIVYKHPTV